MALNRTFGALQRRTHLLIARISSRIGARSPRFEAALDLITNLLHWVAASLLAIAFLNDPPFLALGLAILGGILMGIEVHRGFERSFWRKHPSQNPGEEFPYTALETTRYTGSNRPTALLQPSAKAGFALRSPRIHALGLSTAELLHWSTVGLIGLNFGWFVFTDRPPVVGLLALGGVLLLRLVCMRTLFAWTPHDLPIVLLVLLTALSALVLTVEPSLSLPKLYGVLLSLLLYYEIVYGLRSGVALNRWLIMLSLLGIGMAVLGVLGSNWFTAKLVDLSKVYSFIPQRITDIPRSLRGGFHPNGVAATLIFVIPLYATQLVEVFQHHRAPRTRLDRLPIALLLLALLCTLATLLLTQSRGALGGLAIASVALFFAWKRRWLLSLVSLLGLVALAAVLLVQFPSLAGAAEIARDPAARRLMSSFEFRLAVWRAALQVLQAFPLTGVGIGTFDTIVRLLFPHLYPANPYVSSTTITHAHNEFLQVAIDLGIPGFVAYVALWAAFVRTAWRAYTWAPDEGTRRILLGIGAGLLAHQIFGLTDAFMLGTKPGIVMWMLMGIVTGMYLNLAAEKRGMWNDEGGTDLHRV